MKLKRDGFTLAEVLAIIVVLGVLLTVSLTSIFTLMESSKEKSYENLVLMLEQSAELYVFRDRQAIESVINTTGVYEITLEELINEEMLKSDLIDPRTNEPLDLSKRVLVMKDANNLLIYCFEDNECPEPYIPLDTTPPIITMLGDNPVYISLGDTYIDAGATAIDDIDGDITSNIEVVSTVNTSVEGVYTVTYNVSDNAGNPAVEQVRTVIVEYVFICGDTLVDDRDSEEYATVEMGDQCWMAENLRYTDSGSLACLTNTWNDSAPFNACRVNGGSGWDRDEVLYQWEAAMDGEDTPESQGLCPEGWYIPSHNDWTDLERYVCNEAGNGDCNTKFPKDTTTTGYRGTDEGRQLKSTYPSWSGTNTVGFNAKPAGHRTTSGGSLSHVGLSGLWWSSSPDGSNAWRRFLWSSHFDVYRDSYSQARGGSVRCVLGQ